VDIVSYLHHLDPVADEPPSALTSGRTQSVEFARPLQVGFLTRSPRSRQLVERDNSRVILQTYPAAVKFEAPEL
jgi:hypothetical protein